MVGLSLILPMNQHAHVWPDAGAISGNLYRREAYPSARTASIASSMRRTA